jgi:hypothetical protein
MRRPRLFALLLVSLTVLSLLAVAGCGAAGTSSTSTGGPATAASGATTTSPAVASVGDTTTTTLGAAPTTTTTSGSTPASGATPTSGATPASGPTPGSAPDAGPASTDSAGLPVPITPEEIKNAMSAGNMGSPDRLQIYDYKSFGHYAAAYVMAADENVYLVLLNDETGGWAILDMITGLDWETVQADLRAKAAPEDLIQWANPGEG